MSDEFTVYKEWPISEIKTALEDFKRIMYDGAGPDELRSGVLCFDFLTRRTDLPDSLRVMIEAAIDEARLRAELIGAAESAMKDQAELVAELESTFKHFQLQVKRIQRMVDNPPDPETVRKAVRRMVTPPQP